MALAQGLPFDQVQQSIQTYALRQAVTAQVETASVGAIESSWRTKLTGVVRYGAFLLPLLLLGVGVYLVGSAVMPLLAYYVVETPLATAQIAPIPQSQVLEATPLVIVESAQGSSSATLTPTPKVVSLQLDYTNLANWFSAAALPELVNATNNQPIQEYTLSIPALSIEDAHVQVGGTNLNESLIAFPGTALPGEFGAPVIFGHSVLRQFYSPSVKNPRRYNSIFSTIMTLKDGKDKIYITADGVTYTYLVQEKKEVKPEDVYILTQQYDAKRLKLVTCVPEGTYLRRGVVVAQLLDE